MKKRALVFSGASLLFFTTTAFAVFLVLIWPSQRSMAASVASR